jgi:ATP-dependent DNA helicase RecG
MIVHRDYRDSGDAIIKIFDDRIEFFNPGRLEDGLTVERLLSDAYTPKARNKLINLMFKEAGLVEEYGSGVKRIIDACELQRNCHVIFFNEQHGFKVILYKTGLKTSADLLNRTILQMIAHDGTITISEIAQRTGKGRTATKTRLVRLSYIERVGGDKGGYWKVLKRGINY